MIACVEKLISRQDLSSEESAALLSALTDPKAEPALVGAALAALRAKGETGEEIRGFARAMLAQAVRVDFDRDDAVDIVGTGGDGSNSLNLSTGAALLTAACGTRVVKHGNRAVSSRSGSADVLEALHYRIPQSPDEAGDAFRRTGFTFLFAPTYHPALSALRTVRRALGIRTIFNILGPLINPARPPYAVIGTPNREIARLMANAITGMDFRRVFVVHGANDWDEPTPLGPFTIVKVCGGDVRVEHRDPADFGLRRCRTDELAGGDASYNAARLRDAFAGEKGAHRDALLLGAALALEVTGRVTEFGEGLAIAVETLDSGAAVEFLDGLTERAGGSPRG